jgi:hypothetical protein
MPEKKTPPDRRWIFKYLAADQVCKRCGHSIDHHYCTQMGEVRCPGMKHDDEMPTCEQHGFVTHRGNPWLSLMEQIDKLKAIIKEYGPHRGYTKAIGHYGCIGLTLNRFNPYRSKGANAATKPPTSPATGPPISSWDPYEGTDP